MNRWGDDSSESGEEDDDDNVQVTVPTNVASLPRDEIDQVEESEEEHHQEKQQKEQQHQHQRDEHHLEVPSKRWNRDKQPQQQQHHPNSYRRDEDHRPPQRGGGRGMGRGGGGGRNAGTSGRGGATGGGGRYNYHQEYQNPHDWKKAAKSASILQKPVETNDPGAWMAQRRAKHEFEQAKMKQEMHEQEERLAEEKRTRRKSQLEALKVAMENIETEKKEIEKSSLEIAAQRAKSTPWKSLKGESSVDQRRVSVAKPAKVAEESWRSSGGNRFREKSPEETMRAEQPEGDQRSSQGRTATTTVPVSEGPVGEHDDSRKPGDQETTQYAGETYGARKGRGQVEIFGSDQGGRGRGRGRNSDRGRGRWHAEEHHGGRGSGRGHHEISNFEKGGRGRAERPSGDEQAHGREHAHSRQYQAEDQDRESREQRGHAHHGVERKQILPPREILKKDDEAERSGEQDHGKRDVESSGNYPDNRPRQGRGRSGDSQGRSGSGRERSSGDYYHDRDGRGRGRSAEYNHDRDGRGRGRSNEYHRGGRGRGRFSQEVNHEDDGFRDSKDVGARQRRESIDSHSLASRESGRGRGRGDRRRGRGASQGHERGRGEQFTAVVKDMHVVQTDSGTIEYRFDVEKNHHSRTKAELLPDGKVKFSRGRIGNEVSRHTSTEELSGNSHRDDASAASSKSSSHCRAENLGIGRSGRGRGRSRGGRGRNHDIRRKSHDDHGHRKQGHATHFEIGKQEGS